MLAAARRERGLLQVELATRLRRSQSYVARFEVGERRLDLYELALVCPALELDPVTTVAAFLEGLPARRA